MNDFSNIESELKQLRPRATSPELTARIERALAEQPGATRTAGVLPRKTKFRWFALGLTAAAAAAVLMTARLNVDRAPRVQQQAIAARTAAAVEPSASTAEKPSGFVPDGLTRVVYHTRDEGLVFPESARQPVRRVRSRARETLQWKEPATGASLRVSYPTEEVRLIPISVQ
ncbi:hypothetical protein BH18VER1_BH18VER1_15140 [soil metagenome]